MHRRGLTLIEVSIVLTVLVLLLALLLPAVQSAREGSRRTQCRNNLKQISLGVSQYESVFGCYPFGASSRGSFHSTILPFVGYEPLYEAIPSMLAGKSFRYGPAELRNSRIPIYHCPSETARRHCEGDDGGEMTSYAGNAGTGTLRDGFNGVFGYPQFPTLDGKMVRASDIRGGLSNTSLVAEILHYDADHPGQRLRVNWNTPQRYTPADFEVFRNVCERIPPDPMAYGWKGIEKQRGVPWTLGNMAVTLYTHTLPPNRPSCLNGIDVTTAISGSASMHNQGLNVAYCDGHIQFVSNSIDRAVWAQAGSRE